MAQINHLQVCHILEDFWNASVKCVTFADLILIGDNWNCSNIVEEHHLRNCGTNQEREDYSNCITMVQASQSANCSKQDNEWWILGELEVALATC